MAHPAQFTLIELLHRDWRGAGAPLEQRRVATIACEDGSMAPVAEGDLRVLASLLGDPLQVEIEHLLGSLSGPGLRHEEPGSPCPLPVGGIALHGQPRPDLLPGAHALQRMHGSGRPPGIGGRGPRMTGGATALHAEHHGAVTGTARPAGPEGGHREGGPRGPGSERKERRMAATAGEPLSVGGVPERGREEPVPSRQLDVHVERSLGRGGRIRARSRADHAHRYRAAPVHGALGIPGQDRLRLRPCPRALGRALALAASVALGSRLHRGAEVGVLAP